MKQSRSALQNLYGAAGVIFPDNTTREISEEDERDFGQDVTDSDFNLIDDAFSGAKGLFANITTIAGLKALVTVGVPVNVVVLFKDAGSGDVLRVYQLTAGTTAESSPSVIRPNDYAGGTNEKIWSLAVIASVSAGTLVHCADIDLSSDTLPVDADGIGTGTLGAILKGNRFKNTGTSSSLLMLDGNVFYPGTVLEANQDSPTTIDHWDVSQIITA